MAFSFDSDIFVINVDGTNRCRLTMDPAADRHASWSPDGSKIAFNSWRLGQGISEIYRMNSDGSSQRRITVLPCCDRPYAHLNYVPDWSH